MKEKKVDSKCCLCGNEIESYGNNPAPIKTKSAGDVCCDECNYTKVIPTRLGLRTKSLTLLETLDLKGEPNIINDILDSKNSNSK